MAAKKHTSVDGVRFVKAPRTEAAERTGSLNETVAGILRDVREEGDEAVRRFGKTFDKVDLDGFEVGFTAREAAVAALDPQTRADTAFAIERVRAFAEAQLATILPLEVEASAGRCISATASSRSRRVGCLRARRPLSPAVGARHDHRAREGRGLRRGDRLPAADGAPGDDRRLPSVRRRPHLSHRRRAGDRRDGLRHRDRARRSTRSSAPATPT